MQEPAQRFILNMEAIKETRPTYHADHAINDWVEVILGNGMPPIRECCITAVKFSQGGHVHFDLLYVTHVDDDGTKNFQKLYHVPTGLINATQIQSPPERPDIFKQAGDLLRK